MEKASQGDGSSQPLPPQSLVNPLNVKPEHGDGFKRTVMERPRNGGISGKPIPLLTNYFKVSIEHTEKIFYQYSVSIRSNEMKAANSKATRRKVVDKLCQTHYSSELARNGFAYDGVKFLYTVDLLPPNNSDRTVDLEESIMEYPCESSKRGKRVRRSKSFNVAISHYAQIPLSYISRGLQSNDPKHVQEALSVLNVILRQQAANRGYLLVRQSFFYDDSRYFTDIGGGVTSCQGIHSCFHHTIGGVSLNTDVSTTMTLTPGPVIDFLLAYKNAKEPSDIDWDWAKKMLKNMRVKTSHNKMEFKIIGLSENPCNKQFFSMKAKTVDGAHEGGETVKVTVYEYFTKYRKIKLSSSAYIPCLDVGKPNRPTYLPLELCSLVSLQRYTKSLSGMQRASLLTKSRQNPQEKIQVITDALKNCNYNHDPLLAACGIRIEEELSHVNGRVLEAPELKVGGDDGVITTNGCWDFTGKQLHRPTKIKRWVIVDFSAQCDTNRLLIRLMDFGKSKGIEFKSPLSVIKEAARHKREDSVIRVEKMFEQITSKHPDLPQFLLCVLTKKKNCLIYGPWKKKSLSDLGVVTQCISPLQSLSDQYLTNLLLKINSKLGGMNWLLAIERPSSLPFIKDTPTMILGMDVSHGSFGRSDFPSIAAVVGSTSWPLISRYGAAVRAQSPKVEMIESLYKPLADGEDGGIMRELLTGFYKSSGKRRPAQIIVFRDGVSESQFPQVLNIEIDQMIKAYNHLEQTCKHPDDVKLPKFTVIIAQKIHHTKLFQYSDTTNVPSGTVVDTEIVHPINYDFYICSHAGMIGTSRPAHYHVLINEIGFSPDELQNLIHNLSYVYQRCTKAISIVAPVQYAHLAALQMGKFIKFGDSVSVPELPRLHDKVAGSMFFC